MIGFVYQLVCPKSKSPIYVGSTVRSLKERLGGHVCNIQRSESPLYLFLRKNKVIPTIEVLQEIVIDSGINELREIELWWVRKLSKSGIKLFNKIDGIGSRRAHYVPVRIPIKIMAKVECEMKKSNLGNKSQMIISLLKKQLKIK